eukprot:5103759-Pyramimonas_sp.AAC.1
MVMVAATSARKKHLKDEIDESVELNVVDATGTQHTIRVLHEACSSRRLRFELTAEAVHLLTLAPSEEQAATAQPVITEPNVVWIRHRQCVRAKYFDGE